MKEIKRTELVEKEVTIYQSDNGCYSSANKDEVELYEALRNNKLKRVEKFDLPEIYDSYYVFEIRTRADLLAWKYSCGSTKISFDGFSEKDVPEKISGYFVSHYEENGDCTPYYSLEPLYKFVKYLKQEVEEERHSLTIKENVLDLLESYTDEENE